MKLLGKYYESSIKIIIFKFILAEFKQNLGWGDFRGVKTIFFKKNLYIKKIPVGQGVHLNPLANT